MSEYVEDGIIVPIDETELVDELQPESFEDRQHKLAEHIKDEEAFRLAIAGIYIFLQDFDAQMQGTFQMMQGMGPRNMFKMLFGKGGTDND